MNKRQVCTWNKSNHHKNPGSVKIISWPLGQIKMVKLHSPLHRRMSSEDVGKRRKCDSPQGQQQEVYSLGAISVRKMESWCLRHAISKDAVHMKDPLFCFIRYLILILAPWLGSRVTARHPHKMSSAFLAERAILCFLAKIMSLARSTWNPKSSSFTLPLQENLHPICNHPLSLRQSEGSRPPTKLASRPAGHVSCSLLDKHLFTAVFLQQAKALPFLGWVTCFGILGRNIKTRGHDHFCASNLLCRMWGSSSCSAWFGSPQSRNPANISRQLSLSCFWLRAQIRACCSKLHAMKRVCVKGGAAILFSA